MKHPHAELITEWIKDTSRIVEFLDESGVWNTTTKPGWYPESQYRFKPAPRPDAVQYWRFTEYAHSPCCLKAERHLANLKLTFSGDTGKLKSVEVL